MNKKLSIMILIHKTLINNDLITFNIKIMFFIIENIFINLLKYYYYYIVLYF